MKSGRDVDGTVYAAPVVGSVYPKRFGGDEFVFKAGPLMGSLAALDRVFGQQVGVIDGLVYVESLNAEVSIEGDATTAVGAIVETTRAVRAALEMYVVPGVRGEVIAEQQRSEDVRVLAVKFAEVGVVSVTLRRGEPAPVRRLWGMRAGRPSQAEIAAAVAESVPAPQEAEDAVVDVAHRAVEAELW